MPTPGRPQTQLTKSHALKGKPARRQSVWQSLDFLLGIHGLENVAFHHLAAGGSNDESLMSVVDGKPHVMNIVVA